MILGPRTYLCLLVGFELASLFGLRVREYGVLEDLIINSVLFVWLPLSIWISLRLLSQRTAEIQTIATAAQSASLPLHSPVQQDFTSQGGVQVAENLKPLIVLIAFGHAWLTVLHLITVVGGYIMKFDNTEIMVSISWSVIVMLALATFFLIIGFGRCLLASGVEQTVERWGYFLYLYRIASFMLSIWWIFLWIIDFFEGRIEILRR
ncbi:hypothetical protein GYMLUDRAFT_247236 [Collybiopsis luxurians FD-317 M1]|uniref:Uncharacterized protein n=1 Tax=Collybiopsis luxurians FD-317 M1 TaxID=944289 RepID=A0A0D0C4B8_9AGAR|nr:hypothetical protein GYMLUDRAFT_247236 [Collybiopsis luxurians FD-317 M1]